MNIVATYSIKITGTTPMLWHQDNLEFQDDLKQWLLDPENKKATKAGDDRTPPWAWLGTVYHDDEFFALPADVPMANIRMGARHVPVGTGKKTFKAQSQSGILLREGYIPLIVNGGDRIPWKPFAEMIDPDVPENAVGPSFYDHRKLAESHGFRLFIKRARVQRTSKHVRVRPRFDQWSLSFTLEILDEMITHDVLKKIFYQAGFYEGLGDWRPGSPLAPGQWGQYKAEIRELKS